MLRRSPRNFAVVLLAAGIGLTAYYGEQWYRLPDWSEAEIEQSTELNLAIELQRLGPHLRPHGEKLERLRGMVRAEIEGEIRRERTGLERWIGAGLLLTALGAGQAILGFASTRQRKN